MKVSLEYSRIYRNNSFLSRKLCIKLLRKSRDEGLMGNHPEDLYLAVPSWPDKSGPVVWGNMYLYRCLFFHLTQSWNPSPLFHIPNNLHCLCMGSFLLCWEWDGESSKKYFLVQCLSSRCHCIHTVAILLLLYQCFLLKKEQEYHSYHVSLEISHKVHGLLLFLIILSPCPWITVGTQ